MNTLAFPILSYMSVSFRNFFFVCLSLPQTVLNGENLEMSSWSILAFESVVAWISTTQAKDLCFHDPDVQLSCQNYYNKLDNSQCRKTITCTNKQTLQHSKISHEVDLVQTQVTVPCVFPVAPMRISTLILESKHSCTF